MIYEADFWGTVLLDKTTGGNVFTKKIRGIIVWNKETDVETTNSQLAEIDDLGGRLHKSGVSLQLLCAVSASPGGKYCF